MTSLVGGAAVPASAVPVTTDEDLLAAVARAIKTHDEAAFEELVYWEGAGRIKRNLTMFQIRYGMGRPVADIALEPFPADGLADIEAMPQIRPNLAVSHRLRITYDEPERAAAGGSPTATFLLGRKDGAYRIALVVRNFDDDDGD
jgi:hypothetical protein